MTAHTNGMVEYALERPFPQFLMLIFTGYVGMFAAFGVQHILSIPYYAAYILVFSLAVKVQMASVILHFFGKQ